MSKINFFDPVNFLLQVGDTVELKIQKTADNELTLFVITKSKGKRALFTAAGDGDELDENFIDDLIKPLDKVSHSTADDAEAEESEEDDEEEEEDSKTKKASTSKKSPAKKAEPKKPAAKKPTPAQAKAESDKQVNDTEKLAEAKDKIEEDAKAIEEKDEEDRLEDATNPAADLITEQNISEEQEEKERAERIEESYNKWMEKGRTDFLGHRYLESEEAYKQATILKPEDQPAADAYKKARQWVDRLIDAEALPARKEENDGV